MKKQEKVNKKLPFLNSLVNKIKSAVKYTKRIVIYKKLRDRLCYFTADSNYYLPHEISFIF